MCKKHAGYHRAHEDERAMILSSRNTTIHVGGRQPPSTLTGRMSNRLQHRRVSLPFFWGPLLVCDLPCAHLLGSTSMPLPSRQFLQQTETSRSLCPAPQRVHQPPPLPCHPPAPSRGWLTVASAARAPFPAAQQPPGTVVLQMWSRFSITNITWGLVRRANFQVPSQNC